MEQLVLHIQERTKRMLEILDEIGAPTIENIDADGSQAVSVLALHSRLTVMKKVLAVLEQSYARTAIAFTVKPFHHLRTKS
jgi:ATP phosphoribosyltransferase